MKKKTKKNLFKLIGGLVAVCAAVVYFVFRIYSTVDVQTTFVVNSGDSVTGVATRLVEQKLVVSDSLFKFVVRMCGGRVQSGEYEIPRGASVWKIAGMLSRGKIATTRIVIPEGLTMAQVRDLLRAVPNLTGDVECDDERAVCDLADGDIFPDTYYVGRGMARLAVLDLAYKKMQSIKSKFGRIDTRLPTPLRGWNDVVILASIVQRETSRLSEMPIVASVYLNRLRRGMRLQADPTVVYAITDGYGDMRGAPLLRSHLSVESPYNTYKNFGLPPAPIANVGIHAIRAVLEPADTNYLYFVADGRGGHNFATNYEEHLKNQYDWREIKKLKKSGVDSVNY